MFLENILVLSTITIFARWNILMSKIIYCLFIQLNGRLTSNVKIIQNTITKKTIIVLYV